MHPIDELIKTATDAEPAFEKLLREWMQKAYNLGLKYGEEHGHWLDVNRLTVMHNNTVLEGMRFAREQFAADEIRRALGPDINSYNNGWIAGFEAGHRYGEKYPFHGKERDGEQR